MKYKVGDRVRLTNKPKRYMTGDMWKYLGEVVTISGMETSIFGEDYYIIEEDGGYRRYFEDMIVGLASETPFDFNAWKDENVCMHCKTKEEQEKTMETKIDDKPLSYQEAMGISRRMCKSYEGCGGCPLDHRLDSDDKTCWDALHDDPNETEKILKKWAAEHPVKTNGQKCNEMFLEVFGVQYATALMHPDWWYQEYVEPEN